MLLLDTHILLFALAGALSPKETRALARHPWGISAITLWEVAMLARRGRIEVDLDSPEMALVLRQVHVWPLDREVCLRIKELDFSSDPADEIIAATSLAHNLPLVTRDQKLRASRSIRFAGA